MHILLSYRIDQKLMSVEGSSPLPITNIEAYGVSYADSAPKKLKARVTFLRTWGC